MKNYFSVFYLSEDTMMQEEEAFEEVPEGQQGDAGEGEMPMEDGGEEEEEEEMGDSFDPSEFFKNSALASAQAEAQATGGVDIGDDLQISDDDSDEGRGGGEGEEDEEDPYPIIPTENQEQEGFDIDEFL